MKSEVRPRRGEGFGRVAGRCGRVVPSQSNPSSVICHHESCVMCHVSCVMSHVSCGQTVSGRAVGVGGSPVCVSVSRLSQDLS